MEQALAEIGTFYLLVALGFMCLGTSHPSYTASVSRRTFSGAPFECLFSFSSWATS